MRNCPSCAAAAGGELHSAGSGRARAHDVEGLVALVRLLVVVGAVGLELVAGAEQALQRAAHRRVAHHRVERRDHVQREQVLVRRRPHPSPLLHPVRLLGDGSVDAGGDGRRDDVVADVDEARHLLVGQQVAPLRHR